MGSRYRGGVQRRSERKAGRARRGALPTLLVLSAVLLVSACGLTDDLRATVGLPTSETTPAGADAQSARSAPDLTGPHADAEQGQMTVTAQQREYLDALAEAGVTPSSDLLALSIGSYVCQARAARQTDQAVWDFVVPLVRSDVRTAASDTARTGRADLDTVTADYIRIATERLC